MNRIIIRFIMAHEVTVTAAAVHTRTRTRTTKWEKTGGPTIQKLWRKMCAKMLVRIYWYCMGQGDVKTEGTTFNRNFINKT